VQLLNVILGATMLGLFLAPYFALPVSWGSALAACAGGLLLGTRKRPALRSILVFILFALLANVRYPYAFFHAPVIDELDSRGEKVAWTGEVRSLEMLSDGRSRIDVRLQSLRLPGADRELPLATGVRLYTAGGEPAVVPGDVISMSGHLSKPRRFGIPGEFNWPRHLQAQGIALTAWIKDAGTLDVVAGNSAFAAGFLYSQRRGMAEFIEEIMAEPKARLVRALVLGEGRMMPPEIRNILARAGVSHLFAISGLHIGLVGLFLYAALRQLWKRSYRLLMWAPPQRALPLIIVPFLAFYLLFTGNALATRRAFCLAAVGAMLLIKRYHVNPLQLLASLAALSLLVEPLVFWNAGWQLSFAGAAAILYIAPFLSGFKRKRIRDYPAQLALVSAAATVATLPLVLANFHMLAPGGVIINLFAVPVVTLLALPVGMLGALAYPFSEPLAGILFRGCGAVLDGTVGLCSRVVGIPGFSGRYLFLSTWQVLSIGIAVCLFFVLIRDRRRTTLYVGIAAAVVAVGVWAASWLESREARVTMFSVGQGESVLLQDGQGRAILVDGGGLYSDTFDVGERLLAPALAELGVTSLDAVILTHDHPDHRKGLLFILNQLPVREFWSGKPLHGLDDRLQAALTARDVPFRYQEAGWGTIPFGRDSLSLYSPGIAGLSENDASLVVLWRPGGTRGVLLTGDLESAGVDRLLGEKVGPVDILKLPHHGSHFSRIEELVAASRPRYCLVSSGYRNRYRLPAEVVVKFVGEQGIDLFRTDLDGTVRARLRDGEWLVERWANGLFR